MLKTIKWEDEDTGFEEESKGSEFATMFAEVEADKVREGSIV